MNAAQVNRFFAVGIDFCSDLRNKENTMSENPSRECDLATWVGTGATLLADLAASWFFFKKDDPGLRAAFRIGWLSPWVAAMPQRRHKPSPVKGAAGDGSQFFLQKKSARDKIGKTTLLRESQFCSFPRAGLTTRGGRDGTEIGAIPSQKGNAARSADRRDVRTDSAL
ncbi:MAG: hypothetical protein IJJ99_00695 [Oscillospiraceae bacterium]|nr:hypothetical protein [Oscillospiraceae bacterium]